MDETCNTYGKIRNVQKVLVSRSEEESSRRRWEYNIKVDFRQVVRVRFWFR